MAFHLLKHFSRIHTLRQNGYKSFALISGPNSEKDFCVTLVRCEKDKVKKEMKRWGSFDAADIEAIELLNHGEMYEADGASKIIRLS